MKKVLTIVVLAAALQLAVVSATYAAPPAWGPNCGGAYHCVEYGETLNSIGRMYNALPQCIADANGIWNPDLIFAGTVLYIPATCPPFHGFHAPVNCGPGCGVGYYPPQQQPCYSGCGNYYPQHPPVPTPYYGYDYTGYYYGHGNNNYSYTCGYNNNCW